VPGDARASMVTATDVGHQALERIRRETTSLLADSLMTLPEEQLTALAAALPALEQLADAGPAGAGAAPVQPGPPGPAAAKRG